MSGHDLPSIAKAFQCRIGLGRAEEAMLIGVFDHIQYAARIMNRRRTKNAGRSHARRSQLTNGPRNFAPDFKAPRTQPSSNNVARDRMAEAVGRAWSRDLEVDFDKEKSKATLTESVDRWLTQNEN